MKTQISRDSFKSEKHYSGVYLQQGRMITDADWNEESEIAKRRLDDALADAIASGVPREHGVKIAAVAGQPLRLTRGRLYAEGVGATVTGTQADPTQPFGLGQQADFPLPDGVTPPAVSYRLYADVWDRTVTSLEDPAQLRDPAFHGADTSSRTQTMAQLKWCAPGTNPEDPAANPPIGDAKATLTLRRQLAGLDPCDPCASEVSVPPRIGNYLFRLEVHSVEGGPKNPTRVILKWSSENGAEQHAVGTEPADFKGSDWVYEFYTTRTEKHLGVHLAGGINPLAGQLVEGFPAVPPDGFPFVRRWDGYCNLRRQGNTWSLADGRERGVDLATNTAADADGHVSLTGGSGSLVLSTLTVELDLTDQTFVAGDHWLAPVREATDAPGDVVLEDAPPAGIRHHYLLLATIKNDGSQEPPDTNRQQRLDFPSLTSLAAKDVDYTPNCPSGLFQAADDTVQKALDRVCSIDATQVGFTKPCDTSIFKGVDPAAIKTVAKALALLCDVRADQVSYKNDQACSVLASATNVQEALTLLCLREAGGGCRTTVGKGGDFPDLRAAIETLVQRGDRDLCFCLLPGDHAFDASNPDGTSFSLKPVGGLTHLAIEGCGPASRLAVTKGRIVIDGLASVQLSHFACTTDAASGWDIVNGVSIDLEGLTINAQDTPALNLGATTGIRMSGCEISVPGSGPGLKGLFENVSDLATLFQPETGAMAFASGAQVAAGTLTAGTAAQRKQISDALTRQLAQPAAGKLPPAARELATNLNTALRERSPDSAEVFTLLRDLRAVVLVETPAVVFGEKSRGDITLLDNCIAGSVCFYGPPGRIVLTADMLKKLRGLLDGAVQLQPASESLLVARNQVSRFLIGAGVTTQLRDAIAAGSGTIPGIFRTGRFTDNVLLGVASTLLASQTTLSGNRLPMLATAGADLAAVIAETAFYLGNHSVGIGNAVLRNVAPRSNAQTRADLNQIPIADA
jgi:hypothetical protein